MRQSSLFIRLFAAHAIIGLAALLIAGAYATGTAASANRERMIRELESRTRLVAIAMESDLRDRAFEEVHAFCQERHDRSPFHLSVILPDGAVIGDSHDAVENIGNQANRPEFERAVENGQGSATRFDPTTGEEMQYFAVAVTDESEMLAVVRTGLPSSEMNPPIAGIGAAWIAGFVAVLVLSASASAYIARRFDDGIEPVRGAVESSLREGRPIPSIGKTPEAFAGIAQSADAMTAHLWSEATVADAQRHQQEAVLASMIECVLAVDREERLLTMNQAARDLFGMRQIPMEGRPYYEVLRSPDLQQLISDTLDRDETVEREFVVPLPERRVVQARGTLLRAEPPEQGVVVVLHDVTRLRRLEEARREFVANVSHELRTPITSITGFVETLLDGAMREPDQAKSFLAIVLRQTERLNAIIDDLLSLSRIEQGGLAGSGLLTLAHVRNVLEGAVQVCADGAAESGIEIHIDCDDAVTALMHEELIAQAVVNLVQNAVKYSEAGGRVVVRGRREGESFVISVADDGAGIDAQHLPRLFERFYRVDRARSRELGGTGLGLAIVKHIAQAHGGVVDVDSRIGEGSTFSLRIPAGSA